MWLCLVAVDSVVESSVCFVEGKVRVRGVTEVLLEYVSGEASGVVDQEQDFVYV